MPEADAKRGQSDPQTRWLPPIKVEKRSDESNSGLLIRSCAENGWPSLAHFCKLAGITPAGVRSGIGLPILASLSRTPVEEINQALINRHGGVVDYFGHRFKNKSVEGLRRKVCPVCLEQDGHHRWWWELTFIDRCPTHDVYLTSICGCGKPLSWKDAAQDLCSSCSKAGARSNLMAEPSPPRPFQDWCLYNLGVLARAEPAPLLDGVDVCIAVTLVEAVMTLELNGYTDFWPGSSNVNKADLIEHAFGKLDADGLHGLILSLYWTYKMLRHDLLPSSPIAILGWLSRDFDFNFGQHCVAFSEALRMTLSKIIGFPVIDLYRTDYVALRQVALQLHVPEPTLVTHLLAYGESGQVIEHATGGLIPFDLAASVRKRIMAQS